VQPEIGPHRSLCSQRKRAESLAQGDWLFFFLS
jgi:hypothetical protein